ncbi:MAG: type II secretion system secretin GspD [Deltaproteobacteria bacterium]|nr:type II secretion system secretin GspD [Deltaproteobacteria bacterium]
MCLFCAAVLLLATYSPVHAASNAGPFQGVMTQKGKPGADKETGIKKEALKAGGVRKNANDKERFVTIDFDNVDLRIFIKFISELTGKNFVVDRNVKGKVTIISPTKISVKEAYKVFESVLEVHGFTTVPAGDIIKIVPAVAARSKNIETRLRKMAISPEDKVVTQVIPLRYADPDQLRKVLAPLISKTSIIVSYPPTGMLIVTDVLSNIKRLLRIVEAVDVKGVGAEISVIPLKYAIATNMAKSLDSVFQKKGAARVKKGAHAGPVIRIVPDERTNTLIILASEDDTQKIKHLITLLDKEIPRDKGNIHVYYLQNANAEDLAKVLTAIPSKKSTALKKGKAPAISREAKIVADKATNSLVITADKEDYLALEGVIKKLDIPRRMVYIEALIMEVNVDKSFELGVEWQAGGTFGNYGAFGSSYPGTEFSLVEPGFSLGVLGKTITIGGQTFNSLGAAVKALQNDTDVNILSTPQILTTDNEEAKITVGKNVPYITSKERATGETQYSYSYAYKDVGVTLKITPHINQEGFVRLKLSQEVTRLIKNKGLEEGYPTTYKRSADTTVIVKDNNTVVIGGMIDNSITNQKYQVPCLGGIPGLGWAFKSLSRSRNKTNLFVFLTPHIIENPRDAKAIYKEKKEKMDRIKGGTVKMYEGRYKK